MQGRYDRNAYAIEKREDVLTGLASEDAKFVLKRNGVKGTFVNVLRCGDIVRQIVVPDLETNCVG